MEQRIADIDFNALTAGRTFFPSPAAWEDEVLYFLMLDRFSDGRETGYLDNTGALVTTGTTPPFQPADRGNATSTAADRAALGRCRQPVRRRHAPRPRVEDRLPRTPRDHRHLGQPDLQAGALAGDLPRLRHPEFSRRRSALRHARRPRVARAAPRISTASASSSTSFSTTPATSSPTSRSNCVATCATPAATSSQGSLLAGGRHDLRRRWVIATPPATRRCRSVPSPRRTFPMPRSGRPSCSRRRPSRARARFATGISIRNSAKATSKRSRTSARARARSTTTAPRMPSSPCARRFSSGSRSPIVDGFRVDTVKHMDDGASRLFTSIIHEFAQSLGKENFYLIGEITGGRAARVHARSKSPAWTPRSASTTCRTRSSTSSRDSANPADYFDLFRNSVLVRKESHVWFRNKVVTTFDDHDQVRKGDRKSRFAHDEGPGQQQRRARRRGARVSRDDDGHPVHLLRHRAAVRRPAATTTASSAKRCSAASSARSNRAAGTSSTRRVPSYLELQKILQLRRSNLVIRRGRQYLRQISGDGQNFGVPAMVGGAIRSVVPWSRIFSDREVLLAVNTDVAAARTAWVTIDNGLHATGSQLTCLHSTRCRPDRQHGDRGGAQREGGADYRARSGIRRVRLNSPNHRGRPSA